MTLICMFEAGPSVHDITSIVLTQVPEKDKLSLDKCLAGFLGKAKFSDSLVACTVIGRIMMMNMSHEAMKMMTMMTTMLARYKRIQT